MSKKTTTLIRSMAMALWLFVTPLVPAFAAETKITFSLIVYDSPSPIFSEVRALETIGTMVQTGQLNHTAAEPVVIDQQRVAGIDLTATVSGSVTTRLELSIF